uniref:Uncharacterized protein n=1 Tax=Arundo donax TaxID=35708 RepID=A0A0A9D755_ARUDO
MSQCQMSRMRLKYYMVMTLPVLWKTAPRSYRVLRVHLSVLWCLNRFLGPS